MIGMINQYHVGETMVEEMIEQNKPMNFWDHALDNETEIEAGPLAVPVIGYTFNPSSEVNVDGTIHAWLDAITPHVPFHYVAFFDVDTMAGAMGFTRTTYPKCRTLTDGEVMDQSMVFCLPNGEFLYDRAAMEKFVEGRWEKYVYWGTNLMILGKRAASEEVDKAFYALPSYATTVDEDEAVELALSDEDMPKENDLGPFHLLFGVKIMEEDEVDDDDEDNVPEASFGCVGAAEQHEAIASEKAVANAVETLGAFAQRQRTPYKAVMQFVKQIVNKPALVIGLPSRSVFAQLDREVLPFRRPFYAGPPQYSSKKKAPPSPIMVVPYPLVHAEPVAHRMKSSTQLAPRRDNTTALRAMQANIRDAKLDWPKYERYWVPLQTLPAPRIRAHRAWPLASIWQPVHPEAKAQLETAKPLFFTVIHKSPDGVPRYSIEYGCEYPEPLASVDMHRQHSSGDSFVETIHADMIPAPLCVHKKTAPVEAQDEYGYPTVPVSWAQSFGTDITRSSSCV